MWPIAVHIAHSVICVCVMGTAVSLAKTDEPIEMTFDGRFLWINEPRKHWHSLANTIERPDAALRQFTSTTCSD